MDIPQELLRNSHFSRYYRTWQKNPLSIVFVPLAEICRERGHLSQAQEICEKGLARHPDSISGRLALARIYFDADKVTEARHLVEEILRELPSQKEARSLLERVMRCQGNDQAVEEITDVGASISLWENMTMAKIYADQGEVKTALGIVNKILASQPRHAQHERALQLKEELLR